MKILPLAIFGLIGFSLWKKSQASAATDSAAAAAAAAAAAEEEADAAVAAAAMAVYQRRGAQPGWEIVDVAGNIVLWQNADGRKYFYQMDGANLVAEGGRWPT